MFVDSNQCPLIPSRHGAIVMKRVLLGNNVLPSVPQIAVGEAQPSIETDPHNHPSMYEIYYVLEGEAQFHIGDEIRRVQEGDFFFVPPRTVHWFKSSSSFKIFYWGIVEP